MDAHRIAVNLHLYVRNDGGRTAFEPAAGESMGVTPRREPAHPLGQKASNAGSIVTPKERLESEFGSATVYRIADVT